MISPLKRWSIEYMLKEAQPEIHELRCEYPDLEEYDLFRLLDFAHQHFRHTSLPKHSNPQTIKGMFSHFLQYGFFPGVCREAAIFLCTLIKIYKPDVEVRVREIGKWKGDRLQGHYITEAYYGRKYLILDASKGCLLGKEDFLYLWEILSNPEYCRVYYGAPLPVVKKFQKLRGKEGAIKSAARDALAIRNIVPPVYFGIKFYGEEQELINSLKERNVKDWLLRKIEIIKLDIST